jgi:hypothetical protein
METNKGMNEFRNYIPPKESQRSKELSASDAYEWARLRCMDPFMVNWIRDWKDLYSTPYKGITVDGQVRSDLYHLAGDKEDFGAPTASMVKAAHELLEITPLSQRQILNRPVDSPQWRSWMNPEIYICRNGIRLEEVSEDVVTAVHTLMEATLSPSGYAKARGCMKINQFLGELVDGKRVLNEKSYNFLVFGTPSLTEPWGWQVYGHHLCMNCFVVGSQMVLSPVFMGAEPNIIDEGPDKGTLLFAEQENVGVTLMQSLDKDMQEHAHIYTQTSGPEMPSWRYHQADQRHLGGAFQDNRVIPYEGVTISSFSASQQELVRKMIALNLSYLPENVLKVRLAEISAHWEETYFCWIGGLEIGDAFYYKLHSPVVMIEFDHHTGVFLDNKIPLPFHIHTLVRTPNGNDYGKELLKQYNNRSQLADEAPRN